MHNALLLCQESHENCCVYRRAATARNLEPEKNWVCIYTKNRTHSFQQWHIQQLSQPDLLTMQLLRSGHAQDSLFSVWNRAWEWDNSRGAREDVHVHTCLAGSSGVDSQPGSTVHTTPMYFCIASSFDMFPSLCHASLYTHNRSHTAYT